MNSSALIHTPTAPGAKPVSTSADLALFVEFESAVAAAAYKAAVGDDAPAPDLTMQPKFWADPAAASLDPSAGVQYTVFDKSGNQIVLTMTAGEAAKVNFLMQNPKDTILGNGQDLYHQLLKMQLDKGPRPVPVRAIDPTKEHVVVEGVSQAILIFSNAAMQASATAGTTNGFGPDDRALLEAIAAKVGA